MIGQLTGRKEPSERLAGTLAVAALAHYEGIDLLRVHDVEEHIDMLNVLDALA
jgi:dihydropteroate synthase